MNRRLLHESLESRQLLAANCVPVSEVGDSVSLGLDNRTAAETEWIIRDDAGITNPDDSIGDSHIDYQQYLTWGPDLVEELGDKVFVVDQQPYDYLGTGSLIVFQRSDDGSLSSITEVDLDFHVSRMIVRDNQVVVLGNSASFPWATDGERFLVSDAATSSRLTDQPRPIAKTLNTIAVTVNLGEQTEVIRQELDGRARFVHDEGDRVILVLSPPGGDLVPAVYPPPEIYGTLQAFQITRDGLRETASTKIPRYSNVQVSGETLIVTRVTHTEIVYLDPNVSPDGTVDENGNPDPVTGDENGIRAPDDQPLPHFEQQVVVTRYQLSEGAIKEVAELNLGGGYFRKVSLFDDDNTVIVVRREDDGDVRHSFVDILDLSGDQLQLFESVKVDGWALAVYSDYVVLNNVGTLIIVDTNKDIDLAADNRVQRIETNHWIWGGNSVYRASGDRIVVIAQGQVTSDELLPSEIVFSAGFLLPQDSTGTERSDGRFVNTFLLTVSLPEARIVAETNVGHAGLMGPSGFFEIDAEQDRFALALDGVSLLGQFVFGSLNENGQFERDGSIEMGGWLEIDANSRRMIVRQSDRLIEYRWDNINEPLITLLPAPEIQAVDDEYTFYYLRDEHLLNVLANDVLHEPWRRDVEIVALVDAPEGAEIIDGRRVSIPGEALDEKDSLRFSYTISDGRTESSATVEITDRSISDEVVRELVARVRAQAAEDLGVPIEELEIASVERRFDESRRIVRLDPNSPLDLSPGILVTLFAPNKTALYAASLEGQIVQVFVSEREFLVELELHAVDDSGEVLKELVAGQEFYLELVGKDLRDFGDGVYAAFLDLILPTDHIVLTGDVEYGEGFASIFQGSISEGELDDFGAISNVIKHPGSAPQRIMRFRAQAVAAGEVRLQPGHADGLGSEVLLRGIDDELDDANVRLNPLVVTIIDPSASDPLDANGNGEVSAADALVVINFLHRFGARSLDELDGRLAATGPEGEAIDNDVSKMRRYDTNRSGSISALDALVVINKLRQLSTAGAAVEAELVGPPTALDGSALDDDDDEIAVRFFKANRDTGYPR